MCLSDFQLLLCLLMTPLKKWTINITLPLVALGAGWGGAQLFTPHPPSDGELADLVKICTQQMVSDRQEIQVMEHALHVSDSTMNVWHTALCEWVPSNVRRGAVQC